MAVLFFILFYLAGLRTVLFPQRGPLVVRRNQLVGSLCLENSKVLTRKPGLNRGPANIDGIVLQTHNFPKHSITPIHKYLLFIVGIFNIKYKTFRL